MNHVALNLTLAQTIAQTGDKKKKDNQEWKPPNCLILKSFDSVARPAFEIYKLGTILLNRKLKKNKALYTNIQYITNAHIVNSI